MKKNRTSLIVFLLLAIAAIVLIMTNRKSTIKDALKDFAVKDTATITKIFMADKTPSQVTLTKQAAGQWTVNGKFAARNDAINTLLETIDLIDVRAPVAKSAYNTVVKNLSSSGMKVEIYSKDKLLKTYYVGGPTQDNLGTFMMLENSSTPFVLYIPGFNGYLSTRYFTEEGLWRDRTIFNYYPDEIANIYVEYPTREKKNSYMIDAKTFTATSGDPKEKPIVDTVKVSTIVGLFKHINFEGFADGVPLKIKDSILATNPLAIITVTDKKGNKDMIKAYLKMLNRKDSSIVDDLGNPMKYDIDRMFALINNGRDFVVIQHYIFDAIMVSFDYFKKSVPRKPKA
jgi:hypothetical protein